jgi:hypothetical protein
MMCVKNQTINELGNTTDRGVDVGVVDTSDGVKTVGAAVCHKMQSLRRVELRDYASVVKRKMAELAKLNVSSPTLSPTLVPAPAQSPCASKVEVTVVSANCANATKVSHAAGCAATKPEVSAAASFYESISSDPNYIYAAVILLTLLLVLLYTILCSE